MSGKLRGRSECLAVPAPRNVSSGHSPAEAVPYLIVVEERLAVPGVKTAMVLGFSHHCETPKKARTGLTREWRYMDGCEKRRGGAQEEGVCVHAFPGLDPGLRTVEDEVPL